jgi:hypothetical protein
MLKPFLADIRQVNSIPVEVLFTDSRGGEIVSKNAQFSPEVMTWLKEKLKLGRPASSIFLNGDETALGRTACRRAQPDQPCGRTCCVWSARLSDQRHRTARQQPFTIATLFSRFFCC